MVFWGPTGWVAEAPCFAAVGSLGELLSFPRLQVRYAVLENQIYMHSDRVQKGGPSMGHQKKDSSDRFKASLGSVSGFPGSLAVGPPSIPWVRLEKALQSPQPLWPASSCSATALLVQPMPSIPSRDCAFGPYYQVAHITQAVQLHTISFGLVSSYCIIIKPNECLLFPRVTEQLKSDPYC